MRTKFGVRQRSAAVNAPDWSASVLACPGNALNKRWQAGRLRSSHGGTLAAALQICGLILLVAIFLAQTPGLAPLQQVAVNITVDASHPANRFIPSKTLGAGVDGHDFGETLQQLAPGNIAAMRSAGLKSLTYRLRTELAGEAWH